MPSDVVMAHTSVFGPAEKVQLSKTLPVRPASPATATLTLPSLNGGSAPAFPRCARRCPLANWARPVALKVQQILKIVAGGGSQRQRSA